MAFIGSSLAMIVVSSLFNLHWYYWRGIISLVFILWQAVIFPCTCYLCLLHERLTKLQVEILDLIPINHYFQIIIFIFKLMLILFNQIAACIVTIGVGVLTACVGTYSSVARMANKFSWWKENEGFVLGLLLHSTLIIFVFIQPERKRNKGGMKP